MRSRGGFVVEVRDVTTGQGLCDASVVATDGSYTYDCAAPSSPPCLYAGPLERPGTYHLTVARNGYSAATTDIVVTSNECHVNKQSVTVSLVPM